MKLFSKLSGIFHKKQNKSFEIDKNTLIFTIDNDGKPSMSMYIADIDDKSCDNFAKLLFNLDEGNYQKPIIDMIIGMSEKNSNITIVLEKILIKWGLLISEKESNKIGQKPMIRPTNVFLGSK
jgi:hypothetical protein